ncbi:MAG: 30S ribosomal protein S13 [bacterium]|nr:30S ribosomal protein S13 [bacterium]
MARIAGVDLPRNKRIEIALRYIYGIGPAIAAKICTDTGVNPGKKAGDLNDDEQNKIRNAITAEYKVEGALRSEVQMNIKRLMDIACYRGLRHRRGLPVRGQNTKNNSRTRKGRKKTIAGKVTAPRK